LSPEEFRGAGAAKNRHLTMLGGGSAVNLNHAIEHTAIEFCSANSLQRLTELGNKLDEICRMCPDALLGPGTAAMLQNALKKFDKRRKALRLQSNSKSSWPALPSRCDGNLVECLTAIKHRPHLASYATSARASGTNAHAKTRVRQKAGDFLHRAQFERESPFKSMKLKISGSAKSIGNAAAKYAAKFKIVLVILTAVRWLYELVAWLFAMLQ
jgi:hypothetical protein